MHKKLSTDFIMSALSKDGKKTFRSTIYVPDLVFEEARYQLLDYYPKGKGKGRIIPRRYGLVGRAFRAEGSLTQNAVPGDVQQLVIDWGMTRDEAARKNTRHSFSCVLLKEAEIVIAGIYVDSEAAGAFPDIAAFESAIEAGARELGLLESLGALSAEIC
jgi:hypothetical protein